jgi:hypothetical protein
MLMLQHQQPNTGKQGNSTHEDVLVVPHLQLLGRAWELLGILLVTETLEEPDKTQYHEDNSENGCVRMSHLLLTVEKEKRCEKSLHGHGKCPPLPYKSPLL